MRTLTFNEQEYITHPIYIPLRYEIITFINLALFCYTIIQKSEKPGSQDRLQVKPMIYFNKSRTLA